MKCPKCGDETTTGVCLKCELEGFRQENAASKRKSAAGKWLFVILLPALVAVLFFYVMPYVYTYIRLRHGG